MYYIFAIFEGELHKYEYQHLVHEKIVVSLVKHPSENVRNPDHVRFATVVKLKKTFCQKFSAV